MLITLESLPKSQMAYGMKEVCIRGGINKSLQRAVYSLTETKSGYFEVREARQSSTKGLCDGNLGKDVKTEKTRLITWQDPEESSQNEGCFDSFLFLEEKHVLLTPRPSSVRTSHLVLCMTRARTGRSIKSKRETLTILYGKVWGE